MLDIQTLRDDATSIAAKLKTRGFDLDTQKLTALELQRKTLQTLTQSLQNERNTHSKLIGIAKAKGENIDALLGKIGDLGDRLELAKNELNAVTSELDELLLNIPNLPHASVPQGRSE